MKFKIAKLEVARLHSIEADLFRKVKSLNARIEQAGIEMNNDIQGNSELIVNLSCVLDSTEQKIKRIQSDLTSLNSVYHTEVSGSLC